MGKVKKAVNHAIWKTKRFAYKHPKLCRFGVVFGAGVITGKILGKIIGHSLMNGLNEIYPEVINKGASEYQRKVAEEIPEAYDLIREKYPDGMYLDCPEVTIWPFIGKIKFKD